MRLSKNQSGFSARGGPASGWALPIVISRLGRISLWLIIVVVLIAAGGVGYYFYLSRDEALRDKTSQEQVDETADLSFKALATEDWKVYKNGGYGYEFKYPDSFHVEITLTKISDLPEKTETGLSLAEVLNEQGLIYNSGVDDDCSIIGASMLRQTVEVSMPRGSKSYCKIKQFGQIKGKLQKFNTEEHRMEEYKEMGEYSYSFFQMNFIFYRKEARISLSIDRDFLPEPQPLDRDTRIAKFNEYFDSLTVRDPTNPDLIYYDTFENILSTLKFIEESKITDWETYQNESYGFSFAHPRDFRPVENENWGESILYLKDPVIFEVALIQDIYTHPAQIPVICFEVVKTDKTIEQLLDYLKEAVSKRAKLQVEDPISPFYGWSPPEIESVETITIGNFKMTKVVHYRGPGAPLTSLLQYYVTRPGYVFVFSANYDTRCDTRTGLGDCGATEKETLPRILSTFKFIK